MAVEELTKKEQIINFAQNDPFLKISDIAEYVQTTPRYVRTILSEANISLMKLREKYARSMEKRLQVNDEPDELTSIRFKSVDGNWEFHALEIETVLDEEFDDLQRIAKEEKLWRIQQVGHSRNKPACVKELITFFPEDLNNEKLETLETVYELFGRKGINRLQFRDHIVKFDTPDEKIRKSLGLKKTDLVMCISRYILLNKIPIGMENSYFKLDKVQMSFPGDYVM